MQIWRLVAHHKNSEDALQKMKEFGRIAIGWSDLGDLTQLKPSDGKEISPKIKSIRADVSNAMMAG